MMPAFKAVSLLVSLQAAASSPATIIKQGLGFTNQSISVQVCAGLYNRRPAAEDAVYVIDGGQDVDWLKDVYNISDPDIMPSNVFVERCLQEGGPAKGYIRYNHASQQEILFNIVTLAAVLDAVPLEDGDPLTSGSKMLFDAVSTFAGFDELEATQYMYENHVESTTTMAKQNPGWRQIGNNPFNKSLSHPPYLGLIDYIVKEKLFTFYMYFSCIPFTKEHRLMERIAQKNPWPKPITVFGYDNSIQVGGGDVFEAETSCVKEHNMGQVATDGVSNLAFWSRTRITDPLPQNHNLFSENYDQTKTYVTFIVGDGDNVAFVKSSRKSWMQHRVDRCKADASLCFPLVWTISPHLIELAPAWLQWFYNKSYETGSDYFILPPSGDLYSYPSEMTGDVQKSFINRTEQDCHLLNTSASVSWEWAGSWPKAIRTYFPGYSEHGIVRGFFPVNVPYPLPVLAFGRKEFFKVLGPNKNVVLFKPREWRGGRETSSFPFGLDKGMELNATNMAKEISEYPKGTVTAIYMTSDGGLNLDLLNDMVEYLGDHVKIVNHDSIVDMALQSHKQRSLELVV